MTPAPARSGVAGILGLAALVAGLVAGPPSAAVAQQIAGGWDADERVVITDFQRVTALARSSDRLFAATDGGLVVMSDAFERWELPVTREDGWPDERVHALGWDRRDGSLWIATRSGRLLQLDMFGRRWLDELPVQGTVTRILVPADDPSSLLLRRGDRWYSLDPFTRQEGPAGEADVRRAIDADFDLRRRSELLADLQWESAQAFLGRRGPDRYQVTDVMPSSAGSGQFWVATYGGFLERYDSYSGNSEPLDYGLIGVGAAAVMAVGDSLWFAPRYASDRYAVATSGPDLEEWRTWDDATIGFEGDAPDGPVRAWLHAEGQAWAGGDRGVQRFDGERWHRQPLGGRAGAAPVTSLAAGPTGLEGVWVGTERGLLRIRSPGAPPDALMMNARGVRALASFDGDLWIGTEGGVARLRGDALPGAGDGPEDAAPAVGPDLGAGPAPERAGPPGRVGALAADGGRLYAGVDRALWVRSADEDWEEAAPLGVLAARVSAVAVDGDVVWVGTDEGLVAWDTSDDRVTTFTFAAGDLPTGPRGERRVYDIAAGRDGSVWAATPAGAVRLDPDW